MTREPHLIKTDVLIVGGGTAALNAAIAAAERGCRVAVADKGSIERSGDIGGGVDHFLAYLRREGSWDSRAAFLEYVWSVGKGTGDLSIIDAVFCSELSEAIDRRRRIGVPLTQPDGSFFRKKSMGQPGPYWVNFNGENRGFYEGGWNWNSKKRASKNLRAVLSCGQRQVSGIGRSWSWSLHCQAHGPGSWGKRPG